MTAPVWDVLYPRRRGSWPGYLGDDPIVYDPMSHTSRVHDPDDDQALPGLRAWLELGDLVSYRPRVRATVRVRRSRTWFVKVSTERRIARLAHVEDMATVACHRARKTAGIFSNPDENVLSTRARVVQSGVIYVPAPGSSLNALLARRDPTGALGIAGKTLAKLHRAVPEGEIPRGIPYGISEWANWAQVHDQSCPTRLTRDARALDDDLPVVAESEVLIHGDLHDKNLFIGERRGTLIDLASMHVGRPSEDAGMLAAHLILRALQQAASIDVGRAWASQMLNCYWSAGGVALAEATAVEMARTLARLACLYRLRRRWHPITRSLMDAALTTASA